MSKNVILVDADYIDAVAFDLTVNFERMLGRQIPKADMARWVDCVALDGGVREGDNETRVILIHDKEATSLKNFAPGNYTTELNGQAFKDHLGEFSFEAYAVEAMTTKDDFLIDALETICQQQDIQRVMVVADDHLYQPVRQALARKQVTDGQLTIFTMQPAMGNGSIHIEILGYSLMAALGISSSEIHPNE